IGERPISLAIKPRWARLCAKDAITAALDLETPTARPCSEAPHHWPGAKALNDIQAWLARGVHRAKSRQRVGFVPLKPILARAAAAACDTLTPENEFEQLLLIWPNYQEIIAVSALAASK